MSVRLERREQKTGFIYLIGVTLVRRGDDVNDLHVSRFIVFTADEFALIKQAVHGERDVGFAHVSAAAGCSEAGVGGVMHHHQDPRFGSWEGEGGVRNRFLYH